LAGLPEPKTKEQLDEIMRLFHAAVHERDVVCCVCDQFLRISESTLVPSTSLPTAFFEKLQQPTGKKGDANVLHPQLVRQYDVSESFPSERNRFAKLLLSSGVRTGSSRRQKQFCKSVSEGVASV
jgi:hypothetical protein